MTLLVIVAKHSASKWWPARASAGPFVQLCGSMKFSRVLCKSHSWSSNPRHAQYSLNSSYNCVSTSFSSLCSSSADKTYRTIRRSFAVWCALTDLPSIVNKLLGIFRLSSRSTSTTVSTASVSVFYKGQPFKWIIIIFLVKKTHFHFSSIEVLFLPLLTGGSVGSGSFSVAVMLPLLLTMMFGTWKFDISDIGSGSTSGASLPGHLFLLFLLLVESW